MSCTECKPPYRAHVILQIKTNIYSRCIFFPPSPEGGVDLQGFAQHLGSDVVHIVSAQVHFSQAGVAAQGIDQHGAPRAQARLGQGQRLQGLERQRGKKGAKGMCVRVRVCLFIRGKMSGEKRRGGWGVGMV